MVKLNFLKHIKTFETFFYNPFFQYIKMFHKRLVIIFKIFLKKKAKSANMLVSDMKIFLNKKKKRSINMFTDNINIFKRRKNEG